MSEKKSCSPSPTQTEMSTPLPPDTQTDKREAQTSSPADAENKPPSPKVPREKNLLSRCPSHLPLSLRMVPAFHFCPHKLRRNFQGHFKVSLRGWGDGSAAEKTLLFWRTQVRFPASLAGIPHTAWSVSSPVLFWLLWHSMGACVHMHTHKHK